MTTWNPQVEPEADVWIGKQRNEWVVHLFVNEVHAIIWAADDIQHRDIWRAHVTLGEELVYVPPGEARLRPKVGGA